MIDHSNHVLMQLAGFVEQADRAVTLEGHFVLEYPPPPNPQYPQTCNFRIGWQNISPAFTFIILHRVKCLSGSSLTIYLSLEMEIWRP